VAMGVGRMHSDGRWASLELCGRAFGCPVPVADPYLLTPLSLPSGEFLTADDDMATLIESDSLDDVDRGRSGQGPPRVSESLHDMRMPRRRWTTAASLQGNFATIGRQYDEQLLFFLFVCCDARRHHA